MKKFQLLLFIASAVFLFQSCDRDNNEQVKLQDPGESITDADIVKANNDFAFDLFKEVSETEAKENFMVSPVSLSLALGMSYNGTAGDTKTAFQHTLRFGNPNTDQLNEINKNLIDNLTDESDGSLFKIANSIWANESFPLKESFIELSRDYYSATVPSALSDG